MKRWAAIACACTLALLVTTACGGSSSKPHLTSPTVAIGVTATPLPSATPRHAQAVTGIAQVDAFLSALQVEPASERRQAIETFIAYQRIGCTALPQQGSGQPVCRVGEQAGQLVEAFPYNSCQAEARRPDEINDVVVLLAGSALYAVYKAPASVPTADYVAIIYNLVGGQQQAAEVDMQGGHIVAYTFSCRKTSADFVQSLGLQDPLYQAQTP